MKHVDLISFVSSVTVSHAALECYKVFYCRGFSTVGDTKVVLYCHAATHYLSEQQLILHSVLTQNQCFSVSFLSEFFWENVIKGTAETLDINEGHWVTR